MLASWVKRQRYQFKKLREGKPSTMTEDRIRILEKIGFVWESHANAWGDRMAEMRQFISIHGHGGVPNKYPSNPKLASWAKSQRRQLKLIHDGRLKPSKVVMKRFKELESVGFHWDIKDPQKKVFR